MRNLMKGLTGSDVRNIQLLLNYHLSHNFQKNSSSSKIFPPLEDDGIFGGQTDARLREFQRRNQLNPDGVVGTETRKKLLQLVRVFGKIQVLTSNQTTLTSSERQFISLNNISRISTTRAAQALFPRPALVDFGGQTAFASFSTFKSLANSDNSALILSEGDDFTLKLDHELQLDLSLLLRNDGNENSWLDGNMKFFSGQPFSSDWAFKAEIQAELFKLPRFGPFEVSGFSKGSLDLEQPTVDIGVGADLSMSIIRSRSGREILGLGVEGGVKLTWEPPEGSLKLGFDTGGQFLFHGHF